MKVRRVVTALDSAGKSCIALDAPMETAVDGKVKMIWTSPGVPARNDEAVGAADFNFTFDTVHKGGTAFVVMEVPAGKTIDQVWMHATDTLDYAVIVKGRLELVVETGTTILEAGDCLVDRGVLHGARAIGTENAVMAVVMIPAAPVGKGKTV
jgi:quercetin dioxygenase-like cupin family protein